jgi:hypothetical protein
VDHIDELVDDYNVQDEWESVTGTVKIPGEKAASNKTETDDSAEKTEASKDGAKTEEKTEEKTEDASTKTAETGADAAGTDKVAKALSDMLLRRQEEKVSDLFGRLNTNYGDVVEKNAEDLEDDLDISKAGKFKRRIEKKWKEEKEEKEEKEKKEKEEKEEKEGGEEEEEEKEGEEEEEEEEEKEEKHVPVSTKITTNPSLCTSGLCDPVPNQEILLAQE